MNGMMRTLRSAALLVLLGTSMSTELSETEWPANKFGDFAAKACASCKARDFDCGCELGLENPPVAELYRYWMKYKRWAEDMSFGKNTESIEFVVADVTGGGFGNQMMQAVQGLVVALRTERALVIHGIHTKDQAKDSGTDWHPCLDQGFKFDAVLPLIDPVQLRVLGWPEAGSIKQVHLHDSDGLELLTCGKWKDDLAGYQFAKVWALTEPHLALLNPHEGPELERIFGTRLYFWLSNFLWHEKHLLDEQVQMVSYPGGTLSPPTPLHSVFKQLRDSRKLLVGLHLRCGVRLTAFDHSNVLHASDSAAAEGDIDPLQGYCEGDTRSLMQVVPCVKKLLAEHSAVEAVVLWATDNDEISSTVRSQLSAVQGVTVIQIAHRVDARADHPDTLMAQLDVALLSQAQAMLGTALSTFSFLVHARSLLTPRLVGHVRGGCVLVASPEAGLVSTFTGGMHQWSTCLQGEMADTADEGAEHLDDPACALVDTDLERRQRGCVAALEVFRHGCIAKAAPCCSAAAITRWAAPLAGEVDMANYFELLWSREGWRDHPLVRPNGVQCPEPEGPPFIDGGPARIQHDPMRQPARRRPSRGAEKDGAGGGKAGDGKFDAFMQSVCAVCARKGQDCGCQEGVGSGAFQVLWAYTQQYRTWAAMADRVDEPVSELAQLQWVVVETNGGIGNQMLMAIQGLLVAIRTNRALVLEDMETGIPYDFSSVVPLMDVRVAYALGYGRPGPHGEGSTITISTDHRDGRQGMDFLGCRGWADALRDARFVRMQGLGDVHLPLLNPHEGAWFRDRFGDRLFFFLSRFLWTGQQHASSGVSVSSTPIAQAWDGDRSLDDLIEDLRTEARGVRRALLGVHLRITGRPDDGSGSDSESTEEGAQRRKREWQLRGGEPYVLFSHRQVVASDWSGSGPSPMARYCLGDKESLLPVAPCVKKTIARMRVGGAQEVVVLWATDRDDATREIRWEIEKESGVTVVRLSDARTAGGSDGGSTMEAFQHAQRLLGLLDVLLLSEADEFMGTAHSTFSYLIHARGLIRPVYTGHTPDGCAMAASSEGGLVSRGVQPSNPMVGESEAECLALYCTFIHGCLQDILSCVSEEEMRRWAEPFLCEVNFVEFYQQLYARQGWRDHHLVDQTGIVCDSVLSSESEFASDPDSQPGHAPELPQDSQQTDQVRTDAGISDHRTASPIQHIEKADRLRLEDQMADDEGGQDAVLVMYCYMEGRRSRSNFDFFLNQTLRRTDTSPKQPAVHYAIILVNGECSIEIPQDRDDVTLFSIPNMGSDFAAFGEALRAFGYSPASARRGEAPECDEGLCRAFRRFLFINSSCRGPFIPPYLRGVVHWTFAFTSKLRGNVKLVGPSMHFIPSYSSEVPFCDPAKSPVWGDIERTGAGPRIDGYMYALDIDGLVVVLKENVYRDYPDKAEAVNLGEYGVSRAILESGFSLDCLNAQFQGVDWSNPQNWPGPKGLLGAASVNQVRTQWHDTPALVYTLQPYEAVFVKTRWGEFYTTDDLPPLEMVGEDLALAFGRMQEDLYTHFHSSTA